MYRVALIEPDPATLHAVETSLTECGCTLTVYDHVTGFRSAWRNRWR
jgi:hypothetical protein